MNIQITISDNLYARLVNGTCRVQGTLGLLCPTEGSFNEHRESTTDDVKIRSKRRSVPTKGMNAHYWTNMLFKHIKLILAFIVLLICLCILCLDGFADNQFEAIKSIACMSAGFLFGSSANK